MPEFWQLDRRPIGAPGLSPHDMRRLHRRFELIAAGPGQRARAREQRLGLLDPLRIPGRRILLGEGHILAPRIATRIARRRVQA